MSLLVAGALTTLAKGALTAVIGPFVEEARDAALDAAQDAIRSAIAGRMSIDEWAHIAIESVDRVKERAVDEGQLRFVGGKLKFAMSTVTSDAVIISFQLYFLDEMQKWQMADAASDVPSSKFTLEALDELGTKGEVVFEVE